MAQSPSNNNQSIGKMLNSKEYDFAHCFRPIYYCSRIFGFMPFSIVYDSSAAIHKPSPRAFDLLWLRLIRFNDYWFLYSNGGNTFFCIANFEWHCLVRHDIIIGFWCDRNFVGHVQSLQNREYFQRIQSNRWNGINMFIVDEYS